MILLHAHKLVKDFRIVVVDSRPELEGRLLIRASVGEEGDPKAIAKVPGRMEMNQLDEWAKSDNLQLLNLIM
ncbi:hypothetical protein HAX54_008150 [Datura stramonium]|uniref:Uncharacterized protein n=1 Tax=Datura stramonium TaxID=4076 RepID=A0ABS8RV87_DATST|nr:hypothetical protein [Datura stramonium]